MLLGWLLFPLVLLLVSLGLGLGLARLAGGLPRGLLAPLGFAAMIVIASLLTQFGGTAPAAGPVVAVLAVAGAVFGRDRRAALPDLWAVGAAAVAFLVFAAPALLSGQGTFAGFIRLDDTATWWLLADQAISHGRDLSGIDPSSYNAVLNDYIPTGYPLGAFVPLGVGHQLSLGVDIAFGFQATLATLAALLALTLTEVVAPVVPSRRARAAIAAVAAQGTLLFSYAQWGAIKEVTAALLVALAAASAQLLTRSEGVEDQDEFTRKGVLDSARRALPVGVACAAVLCTLSISGGAWLGPVFLVAVIACRHPLKRYATGLPFVAGWTLLGSIPALLLYGAFKGTTSNGAAVLRSAAELGNLIQPLKVDQGMGIWLSGDFRVPPGSMTVTTLLLVLIGICAAVGIVLAGWRKAGAVTGYALGGTFACLVIVSIGSPWLDAKALATASPMLLTAAGAALALGWTLVPRREVRVGVSVLGAVLAVGVVWSNALVYGQSFVAPADQIGDLHTAGDRLDGEGPTLMTEYEPYGARHFLRDAGGEGASERRNRVIPLRDGSQLPKSASADVTAFDPTSLREYRSLVLRQDPITSRPPSVYGLTWTGKAYEIWQRPAGPIPDLPTGELQLGDVSDPAAVPDCQQVRQLAAQVPGGALRYVERQPVVNAGLATGALPGGWQPTGDPRSAFPKADGTLVIPVTVTRRARYRVWIGGSSHGTTSVSVDGRKAGSVRGILNNQGGWLELSALDLDAGAHTVQLRYEQGSLRPGARGQDVSPLALGPLVLAPTDDQRTVQTIPADQAASLCGKRLDWLESYAASTP